MLIVSLTLIVSFLTITVSAQSYIKVKDEPTYHCYKTTGSAYYYYVNITLYNDGDEATEATNIKIFEDGSAVLWPETCRDIVLDAGEEKIFTFDWPTALKYRNIQIKWTPSSLDTVETIYNAGFKNMTVIHDSFNADNNGSPGFEMPMLILAFFVIFYIGRKKLKK